MNYSAAVSTNPRIIVFLTSNHLPLIDVGLSSFREDELLRAGGSTEMPSLDELMQRGQLGLPAKEP